MSRRFIRVFFKRSQPVFMIQLAQIVLGSMDLIVVGLFCSWEQVGLYGAPHRMATAGLTFGMIFQQVVFPTLARSWRDTPTACRTSLDTLVRGLMIGLVPLAIGVTILSTPLVRFLLPSSYEGAGQLLAVGIWRVPLLSLAFLYYMTLIALNRESAGIRLLAAGAVGSGPLVAVLLWKFGMIGATLAIVCVALTLVIAGYGCLAREHRQPAWHHHLVKPLIASLAMVPVCLILLRWHVLAAVCGGAIAYIVALSSLGGLRRSDLAMILSKN
jgi:O-antigen/teichoic acid export membrane protein